MEYSRNSRCNVNADDDDTRHYLLFTKPSIALARPMLCALSPYLAALSSYPDEELNVTKVAVTRVVASMRGLRGGPIAEGRGAIWRGWVVGLLAWPLYRGVGRYCQPLSKKPEGFAVAARSRGGFEESDEVISPAQIAGGVSATILRKQARLGSRR